MFFIQLERQAKLHRNLCVRDIRISICRTSSLLAVFVHLFPEPEGQTRHIVLESHLLGVHQDKPKNTPNHMAIGLPILLFPQLEAHSIRRSTPDFERTGRPP
jgi:hypothetical protein